jgi:flavin reductase (DIM6/NTAB) family NADH-FMN oxidoreductase RutF
VTAVAYTIDLTKNEEIEAMMAFAHDIFGSIDILVCNAGVTIHNWATDYPVETIDFVLNIDLRAHYLCARTAARYMKEQPTKGNVVCISSVNSAIYHSKRSLYNISKAGINGMVGTLGVEWGRNVFVAFVRQSRHTKAMLDGAGDFTVNIPLGGDVKQILGVCGSKSGRDMDKVAELGLHLEEAEVITSPGIKELPLTLECKVIYQQDQDLSLLEPAIRQRSYPAGTVEENNFHTAYYGQIVDAYIIEE